MTRDDIIKMAREAGATVSSFHGRFVMYPDDIERFAALVAAQEREKVARWMTERGYATGHSDTIEDLLHELDWQIREQEREACAKVVEILIPEQTEDGLIGHTIVKAIRERGGK
jgi:O-methyltransferase involved in polyketide biosynthesis